MSEAEEARAACVQRSLERRSLKVAEKKGGEASDILSRRSICYSFLVLVTCKRLSDCKKSRDFSHGPLEKIIKDLKDQGTRRPHTPLGSFSSLLDLLLPLSFLHPTPLLFRPVCLPPSQVKNLNESASSHLAAVPQPLSPCQSPPSTLPCVHSQCSTPWRNKPGNGLLLCPDAASYPPHTSRLPLTPSLTEHSVTRVALMDDEIKWARPDVGLLKGGTPHK